MGSREKTEFSALHCQRVATVSSRRTCYKLTTRHSRQGWSYTSCNHSLRESNALNRAHFRSSNTTVWGSTSSSTASRASGSASSDIGQHSKPFIGQRNEPDIGQRIKPHIGQRIKPHTRQNKPYIEQHSETDLGQHSKPYIEQHSETDLGQRSQPDIGQRSAQRSPQHSEPGISQSSDKPCIEQHIEQFIEPSTEGVNNQLTELGVDSSTKHNSKENIESSVQPTTDHHSIDEPIININNEPSTAQTIDTKVEQSLVRSTDHHRIEHCINKRSNERIEFSAYEDFNHGHYHLRTGASGPFQSFADDDSINVPIRGDVTTTPSVFQRGEFAITPCFPNRGATANNTACALHRGDTLLATSALSGGVIDTLFHGTMFPIGYVSLATFSFFAASPIRQAFKSGVVLQLILVSLTRANEQSIQQTIANIVLPIGVRVNARTRETRDKFYYAKQTLQG